MSDEGRDSTGDNTLPPAFRANIWKPGVSGNPGGRVKGLALKVRKATKDGDELIAFWLSVMRGEVSKATPHDRLAASELLAARGFGKVDSVVDEEARAPKGIRVVVAS